jgi:hypothetical protein
MIVKAGSVTITEGNVSVSGFTLQGCDKLGAKVEVIAWAMDILAGALRSPDELPLTYQLATRTTEPKEDAHGNPR